MKKSMNLRKKQMRAIARGRNGNIGFFETLKLKATGYLDGWRDLPRMEKEGGWTSPFLKKELDSYEKFCSYIWTELQLENKDEYVKLEEAFERIKYLDISLKEARKGFYDAVYAEDENVMIRKPGEENLTELQIKTRRKQEKIRRLTPFMDKIKELEDRMEKEKDKIIKLYPKLTEDIKTTKMICDCVKEHNKQRMDVYWDAVLYKHSLGTSMPVAPETIPDVFCMAEQIYLDKHEKLLVKTSLLVTQRIAEEKGKGAA